LRNQSPKVQQHFAEALEQIQAEQWETGPDEETSDWEQEASRDIQEEWVDDDAEADAYMTAVAEGDDLPAYEYQEDDEEGTDGSY